ncbi:MAG: DUF1176 domain-containing protein [Phenylobacterium sp.]|uniref:DUF1176 domain-containing protein n=1 Tax=Phenylobacterium sp. TaxID=1871053 RepID=UPI002730A6FB|nr:DUF1176 domain-containing protein [Phenylobacterium sp.]MDP1616857.1 DUF1176 domain-containing protein [Phenylobacterium sp.]MDP3116457.1 DUF1176 domain-containing protein [Phenylobacterium sp.]
MDLRKLGLAAAAFTLSLGGGATADSGSFGHWAVVCDNVQVCTAMGFGELGEMGSSALLKLRRETGPGAEPTISVITAGTAAATLRLAVDGASPSGLAAVPATPMAEDPERRVTELTPAQTRALLAVLVNGRTLTLMEGQNPAATISLAGSSAAMRFMDDRQKRAGTVTALVARGARPASAVPAPSQPPAIKAAPAVSQARLPTTPSPAMQAQLRDCDDDIADLGFAPEVARLGQGRLFWGVVCSRGAYNVIYRLFLTDERGGDVRPLELSYPSDETTSELMNISFDPKTQTLMNFDKGRGLGDCGAITEWIWTGEAFAVAHQVLMPECQGVMSDDWPVSYRSR